MKRPIAPCKDCADHTSRCKFDCEEWKQYETANTEYRDAVRKYEGNMSALAGIAIRKAIKQRRKFGK